MSRLLPIIASQFIISTFLSFFAIIQVSGDNHATTIDPKLFGLKQEKLTHFHFYFHDTYTGSNPSVVRIVPPTSNKSATLFGLVSMMDDPLTVGPALSSKLIGKAQGFYGSASEEEISFIVVMNVVFTEGIYNGSTITILGRDPISSKVREMPVIGGNGLFRFARGYAEASTYSLNSTTGDAIVEYNVYVLHY